VPSFFMDVVFKSAATPPPVSTTENIPTPEKTAGSEFTFEDGEPVEYDKVSNSVLEILGVTDDIKVMPDADKENLSLVSDYLTSIARKRGVEGSQAAYKGILDELRQEMGIDKNAAPEFVLDRVGGVVKSWRDMGFISNPKEKRALFMKLAKLDSSEAMNREVFKAMEEYKVYR
jgi:hypothetical protein